MRKYYHQRDFHWMNLRSTSGKGIKPERVVCMRVMLVIICLLWPIYAGAADKYDSKYCKDPAELQKWANMLEKNPDSDAIAAIHALWIGLCLKVEAHNITTQRANKIFEDFRWGIIESIQAQEEKPEKEST